MDIGVLSCRFCPCRSCVHFRDHVRVFFVIKNLCLEVIKKNGKWLGSTRKNSVTVLNILSQQLNDSINDNSNILWRIKFKKIYSSYIRISALIDFSLIISN